jgi:hypothetical protein
MKAWDKKLGPLSEAKWAVRRAKECMKMYGYGYGYDLEYRYARYVVWHLAQCLLTYECVTNICVFRIDDDRPGVGGGRKYLEERNKGCCGRYDELIPCNDTLYLIGFNYGH